MNALLRILIILGLVFLANLFGSAYFMRFDLTKEQRYSLSEVSKETARQLKRPRQEDQAAPVPMYLSVYVEGDFPPSIRKFQDALRTTLLELKRYAGGYLEFEFVDPSSNVELLSSFQERGLFPISVRVMESATDFAMKDMYPYVVARYRDRELVIDLLKGCAYPDGGINFAKAEADLEYKLVSAMRNLQRERGGLVAFLQGHGEPSVLGPTGRVNPDLAQLVTLIQNAGYTTVTFDRGLEPGLALSPDIDVLLVLQPERAFTERDKYEIDQYLMRGGSVLWMLNHEQVELELYRNQATLSELRELRLDDLFMKYGLKLNYDLVQDLNCEKTEVLIPNPSGGQITSYAWPFFPLVLDLPAHPVTRNVDAVLHRYASSIDTFYQVGVQKSVFLHTSPQSRKLPNVQYVDLNLYLNTPPPPGMYQQGPLITGVMAEGVFNSLFAGRTPPVDSLSPSPPTARFGAQNNPQAPARMALIADGSFFLGKMFRGERGYLPYDNANLILNLIDYLAGDDALTRIRAKEVVVRRLNKEKVRTYLTSIRLVNLGGPILLLLLFGLTRYYLRKRKHEAKQS